MADPKDEYMDEGELSSDESSDTSSDEEEVEIDPQDMEAIMTLESQLSGNPNVYDAHLQYITLLRKNKLRQRLRSARQRLHELFPMSEQLWLDWVNDELEQVKDTSDIDRIKQLYDEAVKDYLSVDVWCAYLDFVRSFDPEVSELTKVGVAGFRSLCERALTSAGLHLAAGGQLWSIFRGFELQLEGSETADEKQTERVRSLFHRQLQVPLADAAATMAAYKEWESAKGKEVPEHVKKNFERAQQAADMRGPYEQAVAAGKAADAALLAGYLAYIKLEQAQKDPARVQVLYERALAVFPVTTQLWYQYTRYLESELKIPSVVNAAYARAVRNCPWVGPLWARALQALERGGGGEQQHQQLCDRALAAGLQTYEDYEEVLLARAELLRRRVVQGQQGPVEAFRAHMKQASELLSSYFPGHVDSRLQLPGYWAHTEVACIGDMAAARAVWEGVLKSHAGRCYEPWAAYIAMERAARCVKEVRSLYKRCAARKLEQGGHVTACLDWLRFEREEGSAEELFLASLRVQPVLDEAQAAAAAAADVAAAQHAKDAARQVPQLTKEQMAEMRRANDPNYGKAQEKGKDGKAKKKKEKKGAGKEEPAAGAAAPAAAGGGGGGLPGAPAAAEQAAGASAADVLQDNSHKRTREEEAAAPVHDENAHHREQKRARQGEHEHDVDAMDEDMPDAAAQQHEHHIAQQQQASSSQEPKHSQELTAFVKGLAPGTDKAAIEQLFRPCGDFREVRMQHFPNGQLRNFCYVEFWTEQGLERAVSMNGVQLHGEQLFIAKSAPPGSGGRGGRGGGRGGGGRGQQQQEQQQGRGGGRGGFNAPANRPGLGHQHQRLQIGGATPAPFVPRSVAAKPAAQQPQQQGLAPKSNDEFRRMLLGGK